MAEKLDIVAAGHICLDIIPRFLYKGATEPSRVFQPGTLIKIGDAVMATGGSVSNTGIALSKLGCRVAYMSSVGDDDFGNIIIERMSKYGDVRGFHRNAEVGSSYSVIIALPAVDRIILHNPGCNDFFTFDNLNWPVVATARHFHLGYPPIMRSLYLDDGAELKRILQEVRALGLSTSIDMALPDPESEAGQIDWQVWLRQVLPYVDVFMPSLEEILCCLAHERWLAFRDAGMDSIAALAADEYAALADALLACGCALVILKSGPQGLYAKTADSARMRQVPLFANQHSSDWANRELWGASYQTDEILSAAGAGDSAIAGILTALLHGKPMEEVLQWGNCLGYQNLRALDTTSGVGSFDETLQLLQMLTPNQLGPPNESWKPTAYPGVFAYW